MADLPPSPRSWAMLLAELEVATTCCLPLAAALPVLVLALSLRLNFLVQVSGEAAARARGCHVVLEKVPSEGS